jgi:hypothetical protein
MRMREWLQHEREVEIDGLRKKGQIHRGSLSSNCRNPIRKLQENQTNPIRQKIPFRFMPEKGFYGVGDGFWRLRPAHGGTPVGHPVPRRKSPLPEVASPLIKWLGTS